MKKEQINLKEYTIRIAKTDEEIAKIKELDDFAFRGRHGVTLEELNKVKNLGFIFILYNIKTGAFVGEAQLLLSPISEIPYDFKRPTGYCYRIGIHPDFQGCGFGKILIAKVWETAVSSGVEELRLSVRAENYPSLKLMFNQGFEIIEYKKNFYGPDKIKSPRLIMSKKNKKNEEKHLLTKFVNVDFNRPFSKNTHNQIKSLILQGFRGVSVNGLGIEFAR